MQLDQLLQQQAIIIPLTSNTVHVS